MNFTLWVVGKLVSLARLVPNEAISPSEVQRVNTMLVSQTVKESPDEPDPPRRYRDDATARRAQAFLDFHRWTPR